MRAQRFEVQWSALNLRMGEQHAAEGLAAQTRDGSPHAMQVLGCTGAVRENNGHAIGMQEYFTGISELSGWDAEQCGFIVSDSCQATVLGMYGKVFTV